MLNLILMCFSISLIDNELMNQKISWQYPLTVQICQILSLLSGVYCSLFNPLLMCVKRSDCLQWYCKWTAWQFPLFFFLFSNLLLTWISQFTSKSKAKVLLHIFRCFSIRQWRQKPETCCVDLCCCVDWHLANIMSTQN